MQNLYSPFGAPRENTDDLQKSCQEKYSFFDTLFFACDLTIFALQGDFFTLLR